MTVIHIADGKEQQLVVVQFVCSFLHGEVSGSRMFTSKGHPWEFSSLFCGVGFLQGSWCRNDGSEPSQVGLKPARRPAQLLGRVFGSISPQF